LRLTSKEKEVIKKIFKEVFKEGEIYLFGSRCDDMLKGGDIDLYIKTPQKEDLFKQKLRFLAKVKKHIGERKIDIVFNIDENRLIEKEAKCGIKL